jgi:replicative DNA helicase
MDSNAFVKMAFNEPSTFKRMMPYVDKYYTTKSMWQATALAIIRKFYEEHNEIPSRGVTLRIAKANLKSDDIEDYNELEKNSSEIMSQSDVKHYRSTIIKWLKKQLLSNMLSQSSESLDAAEQGNDEYFKALIDDISTLDRIEARPLYLCADAGKFLEKDESIGLTCGVRELDRYMNNNVGPTYGEIVCYMGGTGVGKSNFLCNAAVKAIMMKKNVLYVTLEIHTRQLIYRLVSIVVGMMRMTGSDPTLHGVTISNLSDHRKRCMEVLRELSATCGADIAISDLPGKTLTAEGLSGIIDDYRRNGFHPDVIIVDYLDEMTTKHASLKDGDYSRLKHIASDLRSLASKQNVLVITATQTNRGKDDDDEIIDLNRTAESYGKNHSLDYVISINQHESERQSSQIRLFIVKNRNGKNKVGVRGKIDLTTLYYHVTGELDGSEKSLDNISQVRSGGDFDDE